MFMICSSIICAVMNRGGNSVFQKLECVCIHTTEIEASVAFYVSLGLSESWRIERVSDAGVPSSLIGLKFPDAGSSELVLSNNPDVDFTEIEIHVGGCGCYVRDAAGKSCDWVDSAAVRDGVRSCGGDGGPRPKRIRAGGEIGSASHRIPSLKPVAISGIR